jgi:hypothetical protein
MRLPGDRATGATREVRIASRVGIADKLGCDIKSFSQK